MVYLTHPMIVLGGATGRERHGGPSLAKILEKKFSEEKIKPWKDRQGKEHLRSLDGSLNNVLDLLKLATKESLKKRLKSQFLQDEVKMNCN
jgi:hypothetical protein